MAEGLRVVLCAALHRAAVASRAPASGTCSAAIPYLEIRLVLPGKTTASLGPF